MDHFEELRQELHDALSHLHDPDCRYPTLLGAALGCDPAQGLGAVQAALIRLLEEATSAPGALAVGRMQRDFEVLRARFLLGLTQEEVAERLHMSVRSVQRVQREATHLLATRLSARDAAPRPAAEASGPGATTPHTNAPPRPNEWLAQLRQELLSLQRSSSKVDCELASVVQGALQVVRATLRPGIVLKQQASFPHVHVRVHPTILRQAMLATIAELAETMPPGEIRVSAEHVQGRVRIGITAVPAGQPIDATLARELLAAQGGSLRADLAGRELVLTFDLHCTTEPTRQVRVLVIDDNADLATLFEAYCSGMPYEVVHVRKGQQALRAIEAARPDLIVLDVMLPDIDGWDLLATLHSHPASRAIPVIICSVITDERLALTLGAALYLRKPVWRQQLLDAFEQALNRGATGAPQGPASSPGAC